MATGYEKPSIDMLPHHLFPVEGERNYQRPNLYLQVRLSFLKVLTSQLIDDLQILVPEFLHRRLVDLVDECELQRCYRYCRELGESLPLPSPDNACQFFPLTHSISPSTPALSLSSSSIPRVVQLRPV